ncbi:MAG: DMT family transporter [Thermosediminibacteraceae bacterium]|nr:DMT family transporter [Thermosediminibacteraceae bacterium]
MKIRKSVLADGALLLVTMAWGLNFVVMKNALERITPFMYLAVRFLLAFLILAAIFNENLRKVDKSDIIGGSIIGLFLFLGFATQTVGLVYTTPAKSGFITGSNVVMVPFLAYFVNKKFPGWYQVLGAAVTFVGLGVISLEGGFRINIGDFLTLLCAVFFAMQIVSTEYYSRRGNPINLAIIETGITGMLSLVVGALTEPMPVAIDLSMWIAILYAVICCTAGAFLVQNVAQKYTTSTHAAVIMCLEAVFAALFSFLLWGESVTLKSLVGYMLILAGVMITELTPAYGVKTESFPVDN